MYTLEIWVVIVCIPTALVLAVFNLFFNTMDFNGVWLFVTGFGGLGITALASLLFSKKEEYLAIKIRPAHILIAFLVVAVVILIGFAHGLLSGFPN